MQLVEKSKSTIKLKMKNKTLTNIHFLLLKYNLLTFLAVSSILKSIFLNDKLMLLFLQVINFSHPVMTDVILPYPSFYPSSITCYYFKLNQYLV